MPYPRKNTSGPRRPVVLHILKNRLTSFVDDNEMADVNLLSKQSLRRWSGKPVVGMGVYSPKDGDKSFPAAKAAQFKPAAVGDVFGPSWVRNERGAEIIFNALVIKDAIDHLPERSYAGQDAISAANALMNAFGDGSDECIVKARACAKQFLGRDIDNVTVYRETGHTVTCIGHCHIDMAWLWTYGETRRIIGRSWPAQCDLLDRYPEHRICVSQAQQFVWLKNDYPLLWERILRHIDNGTFQPVGGTWTEMDTNLPSGESLIRQFLYGQEFFLKNFGSRSRTFWLPDTFGYSAQIPQIARLCGIDNFFTQKLSWNNMTTFPRTTFNWVGLDGSQLLTHMAPCENYCSRANFEDVLNSVSKHKDLRFTKSALIPYGFGDGGGGPTSEQLEKLRRLRGLANTYPGAMPKLTVGTSIDSFFDQIRDETSNGEISDSFFGELYLEFHRGTYTTQAFVKQCNRRCEEQLHDIELLATIATTMDPDFSYPTSRLAKVWKDVLLHQFHDVLPGSSIEMVYDDVRDSYKTIFEDIQDMMAETLRAVGLSSDQDRMCGDAHPAALNTLPWDRREVLRKEETDSQATPHSSEAYTLAHVPGHGIRALSQEPNTPQQTCQVSIFEVGSNSFCLENGRLRITIEGHLIVSLEDLVAQKQLVAEGKALNNLAMFDDRLPGADAWDVENYHLDCAHAVSNGVTTILLDTPLRCSVAVTTELSEDSWMKSIISLNCLDERYPENSLVEVECEVKWRETRKFLKTEFPVRCYSPRATYETQFGVVERPTHFNTTADAAKFEVCAHRFADLSESDYGIAILNDCKYGFATHGSTMRLSLLRSTKAPDGSADVGRHHFRYAIFPHQGSFQESSVAITRAARNFNNPMRVIRATSNNIDCFSQASMKLIHISASSVVLDTIKRSEDGAAIIYRFYESSGCHVEVDLCTGLKTTCISLADGLEDPTERLVAQSVNETFKITLRFGPFEILTLRLDLAEGK